MRTIDAIKRDIAEAEAKAQADLKGDGRYTGAQLKMLYAKRAQALKAELSTAERARQAIMGMAGDSGSA